MANLNARRRLVCAQSRNRTASDNGTSPARGGDAFLVLSYGNEVFQIALPSPERDAHFVGKGIPLYFFPFPMPELAPELAARIGPPRRTTLDMTGRELVRGQVLEIVMSFDNFILNDGEP